jgi:hypothetical protein
VANILSTNEQEEAPKAKPAAVITNNANWGDDDLDIDEDEMLGGDE